MDVRISNDGETITVRNSPVNTIFQENAEKVFEEGYDIDSLITKYPLRLPPLFTCIVTSLTNCRWMN